MIYLVRYGEIGLKGKNRRFFENRLTENIKKALQGIPGCSIRQLHTRNYVEVPEERTEEALQRLQRVFGIVSLSPVTVAGPDMAAIKDAALAEFSVLARPGLRFKVNTRRANKRFPLASQQVSAEVGAHILRSIPGLKVDVHNPETVLDVEIRDEAVYIYTQRIPGPGGLPVGVSGKGLHLLSGGIDSPVAGWLAMKRGVTLEAVHFYSPPFTSERARDKVIDLCRRLAVFGGPIRLHLVRFTEVQKELQEKTPEKLSVTLMRRMMFRIAEQLSAKRSALALITGESLGQVASQTMESIAVIEQVVSIPVYRPLITYDKQEITELSRSIGTYPISIRPYEDCCTVFLPPHPAIKPRPEAVEEAEKALDIPALVRDCLEKTEELVIDPENGS